MAEIVAAFTNDSVPYTGGSPTVTVRRIDTQASVVAAQTMTEIGGGSYSYTFDPVSGLEYTIVADAGVGNTTAGERYVFGSMSGTEDDGAYQGAIWIDVDNGASGAASGENGTASNPVDNLANAVTLAAALGFRKYKITTGPLTLASTHTAWHFEGDAALSSLNLGSQDVSGSRFQYLSISGTQAGASKVDYFNCQLNNVTGLNGFISDSTLSGTFTFTSSGAFFWHCNTLTDGLGLTFDHSLGGNAVIRDHYGPINLTNIGAGDQVNVNLNGHLTIEASCTAGDVKVSGLGKLTDNSGAGCTVDSTAFITVVNVADAVWDEILTGATHNITSSAGKRLRQLAESTVAGEGAVVDAAATTLTFESDMVEVDNYWNDTILIFIDGALTGQARTVESYTQTNGVFVFDEAWTSAPVNGTSFLLLATHVHPVSQIADGVWDETLAGHTTTGTFGGFVQKLLTLAQWIGLK